jgi:phosphopantetheinyl transferase (holo-ACP synthase)
MKNSSTVTLSLTVLDISKEIEQDESGQILTDLWARLAQGAGCRDATDERSTKSAATETFMKNSIFTFIKRKDQYAALASALLKSRAFHLCVEPDTVAVTKRPVIELPRTKYKKPYLPNHLDAISAVNVSHQLPFVGIARLENHTNAFLLLGFDIVVFNDYNRLLYSNAHDFLETFRVLFTIDEWVAMNAPEDEFRVLREFYIQWCIKEAYTKALGMGLGFDFASFEVQFDPILKDLWAMVSAIKPGSFRALFGKVVQKKSSETRLVGVDELCSFAFIPLYEDNGKCLRGCAVSCVTVASSSLHKPLEPALHRVSLEELMAFHCGA